MAKSKDGRVQNRGTYRRSNLSGVRAKIRDEGGGRAFEHEGEDAAGTGHRVFGRSKDRTRAVLQAGEAR